MNTIEQWKSRAFIFVLCFIAIFVNASHTRWTPTRDRPIVVQTATAASAPTQTREEYTVLPAMTYRAPQNMYAAEFQQNDMETPGSEFLPADEPLAFVNFSPHHQRHSKLFDDEVQVSKQTERARKFNAVTMNTETTSPSNQLASIKETKEERKDEKEVKRQQQVAEKFAELQERRQKQEEDKWHESAFHQDEHSNTVTDRRNPDGHNRGEKSDSTATAESGKSRRERPTSPPPQPTWNSGNQNPQPYNNYTHTNSSYQQPQNQNRQQGGGTHHGGGGGGGGRHK